MALTGARVSGLVLPKPVTFVTGNAKKLEEVRAILGSSIPFQSLRLDLPELQGEPEEISKEKAKLAALQLQPVMEEKDTSKRYSDNTITKPDHAAVVGIFEHPNSDVNWSNAAQGQGGGRGKKPQGEGYKIYEETITANGESNVGEFSFHNLVVDFSNGGRGQGRREFEDICHNIRGNKITAKRSTEVGFENFGNVNYNCKTTSTKDHGKAAGAKAAGGSSRSQANILINEIKASNGSSNVGMFNFHNVYINAARGQAGFLKHKGISHNIKGNTIMAVNSKRVGIRGFGNIEYNCGNIISGLLQFFGLSY